MPAIHRPEESGPPENFYGVAEARKYTSSSRIVRVQAEIADRCIELLNLETSRKKLILDVGCGSGLSGAALERAGHAWVGCDVSKEMLKIASEREAGRDESFEDSDDDAMRDDEDDASSEDTGSEAPKSAAVVSAELLEQDMGLGLPFRPATFDGAVRHARAKSERCSRRLCSTDCPPPTGFRLRAPVALLRQRGGAAVSQAPLAVLRVASCLPPGRRARGAPVLPRERRAGPDDRGRSVARGLLRRRGR